jgi:hypothetical protein
MCGWDRLGGERSVEGPVDESEDAANFPIPVISLILNTYTYLQLIFMKP